MKCSILGNCDACSAPATLFTGLFSISFTREARTPRLVSQDVDTIRIAQRGPQGNQHSWARFRRLKHHRPRSAGPHFLPNALGTPAVPCCCLPSRPLLLAPSPGPGLRRAVASIIRAVVLGSLCEEIQRPRHSDVHRAAEHWTGAECPCRPPNHRRQHACGIVDGPPMSMHNKAHCRSSATSPPQTARLPRRPAAKSMHRPAEYFDFRGPSL